MVKIEECGGGEWWRKGSVEVMSGEERSVEVVSGGGRGVWRW